jgi:predicted secreted protein with PEFG-CTERM motif
MIIPKGGEHIEIVGTTVIPEFGTITMMVLAVAIISIVAVTAKSRIIPRF